MIFIQTTQIKMLIVCDIRSEFSLTIVLVFIVLTLIILVGTIRVNVNVRRRVANENWMPLSRMFHPAGWDNPVLSNRV